MSLLNFHASWWLHIFASMLADDVILVGHWTGLNLHVCGGKPASAVSSCLDFLLSSFASFDLVTSHQIDFEACI